MNKRLANQLQSDFWWFVSKMGILVKLPLIFVRIKYLWFNIRLKMNELFVSVNYHVAEILHGIVVAKVMAIQIR